MRKFIVAAMIGLGMQASGGAVEIKPVIDAQLMGGQNFYNGTDSSFGGQASLSAAPYMKFNDRWSLNPLYAGNYHGTKQVTDIVGGGTLFQDSQDHTFSLKGIRSFENGLKLKAVGGYGFELLRETKDEDWGKGLYDNRRMFAGGEVEWPLDKDHYIRAAYDYYRINFPNYASLESVVVSTGLGRELAAPDVLNNTNHSFSLGARLKLPWNGFADLSAICVFRGYRDQHLVDLSGNLISDSRNDNQQNILTQGTWPVWVREHRRLFTTLGYSWTRLDSNQNHYDAPAFTFTPNYYSYMTHSLINQWTYFFGDDDTPTAVTLNSAVSRQNYADRLVQSPTGTYGSDKTHVDGAYVGLGFSHPIAKGFRVAANAYFGWSDSNNQDNRTYQYHYNTQTYLMGFTYAY
jgi:hypothetical protein